MSGSSDFALARFFTAVGLDVVLNTALHPQADDIARQRPYWEEALRRLGKHANILTWEIANEHTANEAFQDAAGGFWTWHSWDGCEGINDLKHRAPGEEFLKPMADFFRSIPFWRMDPNFTACVAADPALVQAALATPDRGHVAAYFCTAESGRTAPRSAVRLRLPGGKYRIVFLRPADGAVIQTREHAGRGLGDPEPLELPPFTDDLAVLIERASAGKREVISGTQ